MITVHIRNLQRKYTIDTSTCRRILERVAIMTRAGKTEFSVIFASEKRLHQLNLRYRHLDKSTDVLSFPDGDVGESGRIYLGDVVISPEVAERNARLYGTSLEAEFTMLLVHGFLHLLGYDHESDRGEMMRLQDELINDLGLDEAGIIQRKVSR
jgi:probable rRNA maturation factor